MKTFLSKILRVLSGLIFFALSGGFAAAASEGVAVTYPEFRDSAYIHGLKIDAKDLEGKVVLWEYWGIACGPCVAGFPHLEELYRKYGARERFIIVGAHCHPNGPKVKKFLEGKNITFPVYQNLRLAQAPCANYLPYGALIGPDGKVIKADHPSKLYPLLESAMKKFDDGQPILAGTDFPAYKTVAKSLVYGGKNLESKVDALRAKDDDEAKSLCKAFDRWAKNELRILKKLLATNPVEGLAFYDELKDSLPRATKEFSGKIAELKKDKAVSALLDVQKKTAALEQKKARGKRVSANNVASLKKSLAVCLKSENDSVKTAAKTLSARLDSLAGK